MNGIETQLAAKKYALGVFIAFDSTLISLMKDVMVRYKIPSAFVDWTQSMLEDRKLTVSHGNIIIEESPASECSQGESSLMPERASHKIEEV